MTLTSVSAVILAISSRMLVFKSYFTTKGSETSSVEHVDWRTEKPLTKGSETEDMTKAPGIYFFYSSFNTLFLGKKISVSESGSPFYSILLTVALFLCS